MRVRVYDTDDSGNEILRCVCDLDQCFGCDDDEYHTAAAELNRSGRVWVAGGAQPPVLLVRVREDHPMTAEEEASWSALVAAQTGRT